MSKNVNNIYSLPPDLFSRNYIISEGIKDFKKKNHLKSVNILDIGGRNGKTSCFLDKEDKVTILDIRGGNEKNLIVGDATEMIFFEDNKFDVVISGDVFEHIDPKKRRKFILESLRVSRSLVMLACPFDEGQNVDYEARINNFFKLLEGKDHEWLKEHIANGLPKVDELEEILKDNKLNFKVIYSNSENNWLYVQYLILYADYYSLPGKFVEAFYEFYNKNLNSIEDEKECFYRRIYFISKKGEIGFDFKYKTDSKIREKLLDELFKTIGEGSRSEKDRLNTEIRQIKKEKSEISTELAAIKSGRLYKLYRLAKRYKV